MTDLIIILIVGGIIAAASAYVYREKKRGKTCIGCPGGGCGCSCGGGGSCGSCGGKPQSNR